MTVAVLDVHSLLAGIQAPRQAYEKNNKAFSGFTWLFLEEDRPVTGGGERGSWEVKIALRLPIITW